MAISSFDPAASDRQIIDDILDCLLTRATGDSIGNSDRVRRSDIEVIEVNVLATKTSDTVILRFVVDLTEFVAGTRSLIDSSSEESTGGETFLIYGQD